MFRYFAEDNDFTSGKLGFKAEKVENNKDGRRRYNVTLPSLDYVLENLSAARNWPFPIATRKDKFHVPKYLETCLKLFNLKGKNILLTLTHSLFHT